MLNSVKYVVLQSYCKPCPTLDQLVSVVTPRRVPGVVTSRPGQASEETLTEIVERPSDDHIVEEVGVKGDKNHRIAHS